MFSPQGYVETCSVLAWIQLNRELLAITGEPRFAEEIECSAYNDLLGAQAPNGEDWCYYSFPNGKRVHTTYWRCCKSSGAMALGRRLPAIAYGITANDELVVNLYGASRAELQHPSAGKVRLVQVTDYPFAGAVRLVVQPEEAGAQFAVLLRVPAWVQGAQMALNGQPWDQIVTPGGYVRVERRWQANDVLTLEFPMQPTVHTQASRSVQESRGPQGETIAQEVMHYDHLAITRGPLVYATTLIDGFKTAETIRIADDMPSDWLEVLPPPVAAQGEEGVPAAEGACHTHAPGVPGSVGVPALF